MTTGHPSEPGENDQRLMDMLGQMRSANVLFWLAVAVVVTFMLVAIWLGVPDQAATTPPSRGTTTT